MLAWGAIGIGYLLGSISFSFLLGKWWKDIDIRDYGSGNAGATNTLRVLGVGPAIFVLALDIAKGVAAVWIGLKMGQDRDLIAVLAGLAAIVGHNWPIFLKFRGGKGIATTIGVVATLCFGPALFAGVVAILSIVITRYVSLGSLLFTGLLPIFSYFMKFPPEIVWATVVIAVFAYVRHRTNIVKLLRGTEHKIGKKASGQ